MKTAKSYRLLLSLYFAILGMINIVMAEEYDIIPDSKPYKFTSVPNQFSGKPDFKCDSIKVDGGKIFSGVNKR